MVYPFKIKKGTFKHYLHKTYGNKAFTTQGKVKMSYVNKVISNPKATTHRKRQAQFVKNASKWKKR